MTFHVVVIRFGDFDSIDHQMRNISKILKNTYEIYFKPNLYHLIPTSLYRKLSEDKSLGTSEYLIIAIRTEASPIGSIETYKTIVNFVVN